MAVLEYAKPEESPEGAYLLAVARLCAWTPLLAGCTIFLLWLPTRSLVWETLGALNILAGFILFAVGAVMLCIYAAGEVRERRKTPAQAWRSTAATFGVLLLNFPACAVILVLVAAVS